MSEKTVYKDSSGKIVCIGEWDTSKMPMPSGITKSTAEIVTGWDGGFYSSSDPRRLGPNGS